MNMICPKCQRIMSYDPYFKANVCRQCGTTEKVPMVEVTTKRIIEIRASKIQERKTARVM